MKLIIRILILVFLELVACEYLRKRIRNTNTLFKRESKQDIQISNILNPNNKRKKGFQTESIQFTLPEISIDSNHKLEYYYPYFYKTHIIDYYENLNTNTLTSDCLDLGCEWCDSASKSICKQCRHGFFNYNSKCFTVCPNNYIADIYKRKCSVKDSTSN